MKNLIKSLMLVGAVLVAGAASAAVSKDDAAAIAQKASQGARVLSVDKVLEGNKPVWRVKVVTSKGDVRVMFVDESGQAR